MGQYTAYNLVKAIDSLPKRRDYNYIGSNGLIHIEDVILPGGPVKFKRWDPSKGKTKNSAKVETISSEELWRIANAIDEGEPFNIDRILAGSYNNRSVVESLLAHTSEFYYCYPGRIMDNGGTTTIEPGHKHVIWLPASPHKNGKLEEKKIEGMAISEIPVRSVSYDSLELPAELMAGSTKDIEIARRHTQIQIALYLIGLSLGFRTWIAQNDKGIKYQGERLVEKENIIPDLNTDENVITHVPQANTSAQYIDCIWFQNHRFMPAVMEVEHTTGVTSGLDRMLGLYNNIPSVKTRYVIVAPDEDRPRVVDEINRPQFKPLDARYFPYSSVEELYYLCSHRSMKGVNQEFLDSYMEKVCLSTNP